MGTEKTETQREKIQTPHFAPICTSSELKQYMVFTAWNTLMCKYNSVKSTLSECQTRNHFWNVSISGKALEMFLFLKQKRNKKKKHCVIKQSLCNHSTNMLCTPCIFLCSCGVTGVQYILCAERHPLRAFKQGCCRHDHWKTLQRHTFIQWGCVCPGLQPLPGCFIPRWPALNLRLTNGPGGAAQDSIHHRPYCWEHHTNKCRHAHAQLGFTSMHEGWMHIHNISEVHAQCA